MSKPKLVLIVGISPPASHVLPSNEFIMSSDSGKRLQKWIDILELPVDQWAAVNVLTTAGATIERTKDVPDERRDYINRLCERFKYVVALGTSVFDFLSDIGVNPLRLPHPSGLNREINDKAELERQLKTLKERLK